MPRRRLVSHRLVAVFLLGCLLFNYPLLAVFSKLELIGGLPGNVVWLFGSWLVVIGLIALVVERGDDQDAQGPQE
jgi:hypothetical protein